MPGVGSGRSCDACRKRKKKCDEKQPTCSRCERLGITCVGAGQKRYQFRYAVRSSSASGSFRRDSWSPDGRLMSPPRVPSNDVSRTTSTLSSILKIENPGYSLLSFGSFFQDVPSRMQQSPALAAAARALTHSASTFLTGKPIQDALTHYGKALKTIRKDVSKAAEKTQVVNVIYAIGLLCLSSNLVHNERSQYEPHIRGLLSLLSRIHDTDLTSDFEKQGVEIAWSLVIGECIMDPSIEIDEHLIERQRRRFGPIATDPACYTSEFYTMRWENLVLLPSQLADPRFHRSEIITTYRNIMCESPRLRAIAQTLYGAAANANVPGSQSVALQLILCETGHVEMLGMALVLNMTLQMLDPLDPDLTQERAQLILEVVETAERLDRFKPLGTARLPNALCISFVVAPTPELKETMREILDAHAYDFRGTSWEVMTGRYDRRFQGIYSKIQSSQEMFMLLD